MSAATGTHAALLGVGLVTVCLAILPSAARAQRTRTPATPFVGPPAERALSGGIVTLRAPRSLMVRIPAGRFVMGSSAVEVIDAVLACAKEGGGDACQQEQFADEMPAHSVSLSSYWLDRTEVTVAAYQRCVQLRRCRPLPYPQGAKRFARPNFPVAFVSHGDAERYCKFRGARLPTEAEWERAARGSSGRTYPWGSLYNSHVTNHGRFGLDNTDASDGYAELAPVGSFPAGRTPDGILDLAGNVSEWVHDHYGPYSGSPQHNPRGHAPQGALNIVRGGDYGSPRTAHRGADRRPADSSTRMPFVGFRCAKTATKSSKARRRVPRRGR